MTRSFTRGGSEMVAKLKKLAAKQPDKTAKALYTRMSVILGKSKPLVPVGKPFGGDLRASGQVHPPERRGRTVSCQISYGAGPSRAYAVAVHEHLSEHSPYSWRKAEANGNPVQWRIEGTGPKYLEKPFFAASLTMARDMSMDIGFYGEMGDR